MKYKILFLLLTFNITSSFCQTKDADTLFTAFWNTENFYDWLKDPVRNDSDFTPNGMYQWTEERYNEKLDHISQVINDMNGGKGPDIIGFAEVEHKAILDEMIEKKLNKNKYKSIEFESPDARGIDCGLIYNCKDLLLLNAEPDTVILSSGYKTRAILNASFQTRYTDTINVFVNHFPSRRGGQDESEISRIEAAKVLKSKVDQLLKANPKAKIIIVGDFNDQPSDTSIRYILGAMPVDCKNYIAGNLYNLDYPKFVEQKEGSFLYRGHWDFLDQVIISGGLLNGDIKYVCNSFEIFKKDYLLEKEGKYKGSPFPTFGGKKYLGGYSDHLPVTAKFIIKVR
jgi:predicted extracellular nuclease